MSAAPLWDGQELLESLWVRFSDKANDSDAVLGVHYRLHKHSAYQDGDFLKKLKLLYQGS